MNYGYSTGIVAANKAADGKLVGVRLGRTCIKQGIPAIRISRRLKVSKQTVYNWFSGITKPQARYLATLESLLHSFKDS
tara:strand:- start:573 stop:809 length:237 start_codon:yes stop_codon:yes gene_type:complete